MDLFVLCAGSIVGSQTRTPTSSRPAEDGSESDGSRKNFMSRNFLVRITDKTTRVVGAFLPVSAFLLSLFRLEVLMASIDGKSVIPICT